MVYKTSAYKLVFLGESGTGKTSLCLRLVKNQYNEYIDSTIGAAFWVFTYHGIRYEMWDTAGQERYISMVPNYYRHADAYLLVYDVNNLETLERIHTLVNKIIMENVSPGCFILVGNQCDKYGDCMDNTEELTKLERKVKKEFESYSVNFKYIFTSAKTAQGISKLKDMVDVQCKERRILNFEEPNNKIINLKTEETRSDCKC